MPTPLGQLKNIGKTIEKRLNEINIHSREDLARVGSVDAYRLICNQHPGKTIPVCYYLYSFEGALLDLHWNALPKPLKEDLLARVRPGQKSMRSV
ncbi:TfoX/Sxy family protein [Acanthopleuribacter pedis]|uniref:TfoX/Sxy family protein n=1 Tax=Acanthopleuribacter pedis TaxID=442870 RepID=A0A8J7Q3A4_9BACT|nr:TfoX/Sxy family protein [Acanthopleuribacter pedis]MBO1318465.1 TfoX/Sxy family protein [Acanthopleuribacter pedis]